MNQTIENSKMVITFYIGFSGMEDKKEIDLEDYFFDADLFNSVEDMRESIDSIFEDIVIDVKSEFISSAITIDLNKKTYELKTALNKYMHNEITEEFDLLSVFDEEEILENTEDELKEELENHLTDWVNDKIQTNYEIVSK